jgi:hypothetical protein
MGFEADNPSDRGVAVRRLCTQTVKIMEMTIVSGNVSSNLFRLAGSQHCPSNDIHAASIEASGGTEGSGS